MRGTVAVVLALLLGGPALAQQMQLAPPPVVLSIEVDQAQLIVETLKAINCGTVAQLMVCNEAITLLREMQQQLRKQVR